MGGRRSRSTIDAPPAVGKRIDRFGERVSATQLRWHESWSCDGCSLGTETDGIDRLPDELRRHTIAVQGSFCVHVTPLDKSAVPGVLRGEFAMTVAGALVAFGELEKPFAMSLTYTEAHRAANAFPQDAALVRIERQASSVTRDNAG